MFNTFKRNDNKEKSSIFAVRQDKKNNTLEESLFSPNKVFQRLRKNALELKNNYKINNN